MKKTLLGIATAACLLAATAAGARAAGDGLGLGPVRMFPALGVTETYEDNVFLTSPGEETDWVTTISPALRFVLPVRRFLLELGGQVDIVRHADFDDEDATNWSVHASLGADFPGGLSFEVTEDYRDRYLIGTQEYGPGEDSVHATTGAKVGYNIRDAFRVELAWHSNLYLFDASANRERTENAYQAGLFWRFRPRVSALAEFAWADYAYDSNLNQDNTATQAALGVTWDFTTRSTGTAKVGYQWKRYADEDEALGTENTSSYVVAVGLRHTLTRRTSADLDLSRSFQESDFPGNPYFVQTEAKAGVTQRFTYKVRGSASVGFRRAEYPKDTTYVNPFDAGNQTIRGERTDNILTGRLSAGYAFRDWLDFEVAWSHARRASNFDTFEYTANQVSLGVRAAF